MALHLSAQPDDPNDPDARAAHFEERFEEAKRLVADGVQVLARGAMVCPSCALPIAPPPRARPKALMRCGFCDHRSPVHAFVRGDVVDTPANEVRVVARIV
jgi:hypothetical protein